MIRISLKVALLLAAMLVSACGRSNLFEKPPEGSAALPDLPLETSYISVTTSLPFNALQKIIEAQVPSQKSLSGSGDEPCADVPALKQNHWYEVPYIGSTKACAGNSWSATARKSGAVSVTRNGQAMRVAVPIDIQGKAGLRGDIASVLSLNGKNFSASVRPIVDITVTHGGDWCPHISAVPTRDWVTSATVEIIGKSCANIDLGPLGKPGFCAGPVNLDLTNQANSALNDQQNAIQNAVTNAINCNQFRNSVQAQWKPITIKVDATVDNPLFLNITPESLALSNVLVDNDALRFAVKAGVKARLEEKAASTNIIPLPSLASLDPGSSDLHIVLRANTPYLQIANLLKAFLLGKTFTNTTQVGTISIKPEEIEVFPSNGKLAVGVKISAKVPEHFFDVDGWVYMTTKPIVANDGTAIDLRGLQYSAILDNKIWELLVATFDQKILSEMHKNSIVDLRPTITKTSVEIATKINATRVQGVNIKADNPTAKILDVSVDSAALIATVSADMKFELSITDDIGRLASK